MPSSRAAAGRPTPDAGSETDLVRVRKPQPPVKVDGVGLGILTVRQAVEQWRLGMLVDDLVGRVEACCRRLRDIGNPLAKLAPRIGCCVARSMPSKLTEPPTISHPSRVKPIAARPSVDLPAPDSPIRPITSPRFRSRLTSLMIRTLVSSVRPSISRLRILTSGSLLVILATPSGRMRGAASSQRRNSLPR